MRRSLRLIIRVTTWPKLLSNRSLRGLILMMSEKGKGTGKGRGEGKKKGEPAGCDGMIER